MHSLRGNHGEFIRLIKAKENSFLGVSGQDVGVISTKGYRYIPECKETLTNRKSGSVVAKSY
jgi:hypothetical protein